MALLVCTHCGCPLMEKHSNEPAKALFDTHLREKSNVIKLIDCSSCLRPGDEYPEMDGTLILLDLLLQYPKAYRHVLINDHSYRVITSKLATLTLICDGLISWYQLPPQGEFFEQEYEFYIMCLKAFVALSAYFLIAYASLFPRLSSRTDVSNFFFGLLMAYSFRFGNLFALLWSSNTKDERLFPLSPEEFMWFFIQILFFASSCRVAQVVTHRASSGLVMAVACLGFFMVFTFDSFMTLSNFNLNIAS